METAATAAPRDGTTAPAVVAMGPADRVAPSTTAPAPETASSAAVHAGRVLAATAMPLRGPATAAAGTAVTIDVPTEIAAPTAIGASAGAVVMVSVAAMATVVSAGVVVMVSVAAMATVVSPGVVVMVSVARTRADGVSDPGAPRTTAEVADPVARSRAAMIDPAEGRVATRRSTGGVAHV